MVSMGLFYEWVLSFKMTQFLFLSLFLSQLIWQSQRQILTRQNDRQFRREIATKLSHHETIFNFHMNNLGVIVFKIKQNFNNNITESLKIRLFSIFENVIPNEMNELFPFWILQCFYVIVQNWSRNIITFYSINETSAKSV